MRDRGHGLRARDRRLSLPRQPQPALAARRAAAEPLAGHARYSSSCSSSLWPNYLAERRGASRRTCATVQLWLVVMTVVGAAPLVVRASRVPRAQCALGPERLRLAGLAPARAAHHAPHHRPRRHPGADGADVHPAWRTASASATSSDNAFYWYFVVADLAADLRPDLLGRRDGEPHRQALPRRLGRVSCRAPAPGRCHTGQLRAGALDLRPQDQPRSGAGADLRRGRAFRRVPFLAVVARLPWSKRARFMPVSSRRRGRSSASSEPCSAFCSRSSS